MKDLERLEITRNSGVERRANPYHEVLIKTGFDPYLRRHLQYLNPHQVIQSIVVFSQDGYVEGTIENVETFHSQRLYAGLSVLIEDFGIFDTASFDPRHRFLLGESAVRMACLNSIEPTIHHAEEIFNERFSSDPGIGLLIRVQLERALRSAARIDVDIDERVEQLLQKIDPNYFTDAKHLVNKTPLYIRPF